MVLNLDEVHLLNEYILIHVRFDRENNRHVLHLNSPNGGKYRCLISTEE